MVKQILGIDLGISTTDVALVENYRVKKLFFVETGSIEELKKAIEAHSIDLEKVGSIAVTGGNHHLKKIFGRKFSRVKEVDAIGFGGFFLSGLKDVLVVSMGTGTCISYFKKGKASHVAGTALGGGTIIGLSKLLIGTDSISKLKALAGNGNLHNVDLSVLEAIGSGIGKIPPSATASNFAKCSEAKKADIALGIQSMVAESNAIIAALAAKSIGIKKIVFVGKTPLFPAVRKTLKKTLSLYGFLPVFPKNFGSAVAVGSAVFHGNCFK